MSDKLKKALVGAIIAVVLGLAVSYGLIGQDTADQIKAKTNEVLTEDKPAQPALTAPQKPAPRTSETSSEQQQQPSPPSVEPTPQPTPPAGSTSPRPTPAESAKP